MSLESKVNEPLSPTSSFAISSLIGAAYEYFIPGASVATRILQSVIYGAIVPFIEKIFYPDVPLGRFYKNAPADALGLFTGQSAVSLLRGY